MADQEKPDEKPDGDNPLEHIMRKMRKFAQQMKEMKESVEKAEEAEADRSPEEKLHDQAFRETCVTLVETLDTQYEQLELRNMGSTMRAPYAKCLILLNSFSDVVREGNVHPKVVAYLYPLAEALKTAAEADRLATSIRQRAKEAGDNLGEGGVPDAGE